MAHASGPSFPTPTGQPKKLRYCGCCSTRQTGRLRTHALCNLHVILHASMLYHATTAACALPMMQVHKQAGNINLCRARAGAYQRNQTTQQYSSTAASSFTVIAWSTELFEVDRAACTILASVPGKQLHR